MVDLNHVIANWYTTAQAAERTGLRLRTVIEYCRQGKFDAIQIGRTWYLNPASVETFEKSKTGRKRKSDEE